MRKTLLLFAILFIRNEITLFAQADMKGMKEISSPQAQAQAMMSKVYSACSLVGYQANKLNYAFLDYYSKLDELMHQPRPNQAAFETNQKMLKDKLNEKLQGVLTPDQMQMWAVFKEREKIDL